MNVVDIPRPAANGLYEEAASRYAAMVKNRAVSVYRLGRAEYPGLSEMAALVVTDHVGMDNRFFFSALHRLPRQYHRLFLHEPFILPGWSLRVMRHTKHYTYELLAGRHVLQAYSPSEERDERWCRVLESYCANAAFTEKAKGSQLLKGREILATAGALRSLLTDVVPILPEAADEHYVNAVEAIRRTFFEDGGDPVERVRDAWDVFSIAFERLDRAMQDYLRACSSEEAVATARALLRGEQESADFDRDYAYRRARDIDGYHQELASLGFPFGDLFPRGAYPRAMRTPAAAPVLEGLLRGVYIVRRRIIEYAAG